MPVFYDKPVSSALLLGTAQYPSPKVLADAVTASGCDIVTVSLRRESAGNAAGGKFWELIRDLGVSIPAQYRWVSFGQGGGYHRPDGAGTFRYGLDQA